MTTPRNAAAERRAAQRRTARELKRGRYVPGPVGRAYRAELRRRENATELRGTSPIPVILHRSRDWMPQEWGYQGKARVRRAGGEIVTIYSGTLVYSSRPGQHVLRQDLIDDIEQNARENGSEVEVLSVRLVHAWRARSFG